MQDPGLNDLRHFSVARSAAEVAVGVLCAVRYFFKTRVRWGEGKEREMPQISEWEAVEMRVGS